MVLLQFPIQIPTTTGTTYVVNTPYISTVSHNLPAGDAIVRVVDFTYVGATSQGLLRVDFLQGLTRLSRSFVPIADATNSTGSTISSSTTYTQVYAPSNSFLVGFNTTTAGAKTYMFPAVLWGSEIVVQVLLATEAPLTTSSAIGLAKYILVTLDIEPS